MTHKQFSEETKEKVNWVVSVFSEWRYYHSNYYDCVLMDLQDLGSFDKNELCGSMCSFITEVKKLDGSNFPPKTL